MQRLQIPYQRALFSGARFIGLLVGTVTLAGCGADTNKDNDGALAADSYGTLTQALVDLNTCGPKNLALNTAGSGTPSPLATDPGIGGDPWDLVDGATEYTTEQSGLLFDAGGSHQVTVDLGGEATLNRLTLWQHSDNGEAGRNIPEAVGLEYFDGSTWQPLGFSRTFDLGYSPPAAGFGSYPDLYAFPPIVVSKVRWSYDGDGLNLLGTESGIQGPNDAVDIASGGVHSCAVRETGQVVCWGQGLYGQLGNGSTDDSTVPVPVLGLTDAVSVTAGWDHTCVVRETGQIACWGWNRYGQLGNGATEDSSVPVAVTGVSDAIAVSAGARQTCAVRQTGQVVCWGLGNEGQLGNGGTSSSSVPVTVLLPSSNALAVAVGEAHACALLDTGAVYCWGRGDEGQLGNGSTTGSATPALVPTVDDAVALSAASTAGQHTCALRAAGEVACWGRGEDGQLGNGSLVTSAVPVAVSGLSDAVAVSTGRYHSCATRETGQMACWGGNASGQLGNGSTAASSTPVVVPDLGDALNVDAGGYHSCALRDGGSVACWGDSFLGAVGNGFSANSPEPVAVDAQPGRFENDGVVLSAGQLTTCAVRESGQVVCWGDNEYGQLGDGSTGRSGDAALVSGLSDANSVAAGPTHTCAVHDTGEVSCWGWNRSGQLGNGSTNDSNLPVAVSNLDGVKLADAGWEHTCALGDDGDIACWGRGGEGQLGNGATANVSTPVTVAGISDAIAVATGYYHSCAVRQSGQVACWGSGSYGQLGNGGTASSDEPVLVSNLGDAVAVAGGFGHTCALRETGQVACWGWNSDGQLGNGTTADSAVPVGVSGVSDAVSIVAGAGHTCVLSATSGVMCWGDNSYGQLGDGSLSDAVLPVAVAGLSDIIAVAAGTHTCGLQSSGNILCWGHGGFGQLGNGARSYFSAPVPVAGFTSDPWRAWPYQVSVNGCPEPAALESVSGSGSVTTDTEGDGATLADPIETTVTTPTGGAVEINEGPPGTLTGFVLLGQQVDITAPSSTIAIPLQLVFVLDSSLLPEGADENDIQVFKNEALVQACVAAPLAIPDPCVLSRTVANGDVVITVLTSSASFWTFGIAVQSDLDADGVLDGYDQCPDTPTGETVNSDGCSIAQLCPCAGPRGSGEPWKNHGQYVFCVSHAANSFRDAGLISRAERGVRVREAARSECGRK